MQILIKKHTSKLLLIATVFIFVSVHTVLFCSFAQLSGAALVQQRTHSHCHKRGKRQKQTWEKGKLLFCSLRTQAPKERYVSSSKVFD